MKTRKDVNCIMCRCNIRFIISNGRAIHVWRSELREPCRDPETRIKLELQKFKGKKKNTNARGSKSKVSRTSRQKRDARLPSVRVKGRSRGKAQRRAVGG